MEEIAQVYARSLFEVASEQDRRDAIREQLGQFADALASSRELEVFFFSPYLSTQEKTDGLRQAIEGNPADPALSFLYGYQLWFDGRRADAKPHLQKAAATAADPKPIERFLDELK